MGTGSPNGGQALALQQDQALFEIPTRWTARSQNVTNLAERLLLTALLCDAVIILYALVAAYWLRFCTPIKDLCIPVHMTVRDYAGYIAFGAFSLLCAMSYFQVYDRRRLLRYRHTGERIVKAIGLWFVGFLGCSLMFEFQPEISRVFVVLCAINVTVGLLGWRYLFHRFLQSSKAAASLRQRVIFVGWNEDSERLTKTFEADAVHAHEVVGCVTSSSSQFKLRPNVPVLGEYGDLASLFQAHNVDIVMLSDVDCVKGEIVGLANLCEREMVQFKIVPSYFQILVSGLHLESVAGVPVLGVSQLPLDLPLNFLLKRMVDIVGGTIGLILAAPLIAFFGLMVWLEDRGPVFYRHTRMGRGGQPFQIIKIRSMRQNADKEGGFWTLKNDPRRLRVGAFMRAWNIDELPQFWNVLKGEMSLVGPRPESVELIMNFRDEIPHYNARHNAKPGITGWAQIKGLRGDTDLGERIRADLYYLENWNVLIDFQIMLFTFMTRRGAS